MVTSQHTVWKSNLVAKTEYTKEMIAIKFQIKCKMLNCQQLKKHDQLKAVENRNIHHVLPKTKKWRKRLAQIKCA